jgi:hypothetical protein
MERTIRRSAQVLAAATLAMAAAMTPSDGSAQDRAYVGTWAAKRAQCRLGQDKQDAPLVLVRNGYDQHETHCTFSSVRAQGENTWRAPAKCSVEGDTQRHTFTLTVAGSRLTIRDGRGARTLRRCG